VQVSICRHDKREVHVLADWMIAKKAARPSEKNRSGGNKGGRSR